MIDTKELHLEPCPCCGGEAEIAEFIISSNMESLTVKCPVCGLQLSKTRQQIMKPYNDPVFGFRMVPSGMYAEDSAIDLWNRRVST